MIPILVAYCSESMKVVWCPNLRRERMVPYERVDGKGFIFVALGVFYFAFFLPFLLSILIPKKAPT